MFFWKQDLTKRIVADLQKIEREIQVVRDVQVSKENIKAALKRILANVEDAKKAILNRAEDEISRPWIDPGYDDFIRELAGKETALLEILKNKIVMTLDLIEDLTNKGDFAVICDELIQEEKLIIEREKKNEQLIKFLQRETIKARLESSAGMEGLSGKTNDGVSFGNIQRVCRQLGGSVVPGSAHSFHIVFRGGGRPIPLSMDAGSGRLAKQVIMVLRTSGWPENKLPSINELREAFSDGTLLRAA